MKTLLPLIMLVFVACSSEQQQTSQNQSSNKTPQAAALSAFQLEHGIGPVTDEISLGDFNAELSAKGEEIFIGKCSACHKVDQRYVGPELGKVLERRSPAYVMNMMLNPDGMVKEHPEAKKLLQEYMAPMPFQNLTKDEARAIVEYLRNASKQ